MFEELRGLPPKPQKTVTKKRKGCLKVSYGFLVVLLAIIIGIIIIFTSMDFSGLQDYNNLSKELSIEVNEAEIAPEKIEISDFEAFENIVRTSITNTKGLEFFDENHKMNLASFMAEDLVFNSNITLKGKDIACLGSQLLEANLIEQFDADFSKEAVSIIQFNISSNNQISLVKAVIKINPDVMFDNYLELQKKYNLASKFYITSTFEFNNATNEILSANLRVNQLSEKSNNLLLALLVGGSASNNNDAIKNFCKKPAEIFIELLKEFKTKYDAILVFNQNTITAIKV